MIIHGLVFYLFAAIVVASAVMVISARNPVHSVLFLILAFFNAAGLFLLMGPAFLAMILVVVYVGAVAVLFLFVVMMLDVSLAEIQQGFLQYLPVGALVGLVLLIELIMALGAWTLAPGTLEGQGMPIPDPGQVTNTEALGNVIYGHYVYLFQTAGIILLVAMIGAIVLTLRQRPGVRRQSIARQVTRKPTDAVELKDMPSGGGV